MKERRGNREAIDFAKDPVGRLFRKLFFPNLLTMVSMVALNITDGAFVGHGAGSSALAAVNIAAPIFMLITGLGLTFGIGGSVAAAILLGKEDSAGARRNITEALTGGFLLAMVLGAVILIFPEETCRLFGSSETLLPLARMYICWIAPFMPLCVIETIGSFIIRLDGSPKFAAGISMVMAGFNIVLDYILVFPCHLGLKGAAMATGISYALSGVVTLAYILFFSKTLKLTGIRADSATLKELGHQINIGFSGLLGELAIASLIVMGNYQFLKYLGDDGVAAYSVACYCTPVIFMMANAIVQSSQPVISFAYGAGDRERTARTLKVCLATALLCGLVVTGLLAGASDLITSVFLPEGNAHELCREGLPLFSAMTVFVILNVVMTGYNQSMENALRATVYTLLRGFIFMIPAFIMMPELAGRYGLWLALAVSEALTCIVVAATELLKGGFGRCPR